MSRESSPGPRIDPRALMVLAWTWVALPFGYGIYQLLHKINALFSN